MSLALANVEVLHRGWEDAVSEVTPHLPEVRATMETKYAAAVRNNQLDEKSLLEAAQQVASVATRTAGADTGRLLSRELQRTVYEYLLSLDAMTAEETAPAQTEPGADADRSRLIGFEEVAELEGRQAALAAAAESSEAPDEQAAAADDLSPIEAATEELLDAPASDLDQDAAGARYRPRFRLFRRGSREGDGGGASASSAQRQTPEWWLGPDAPPSPPQGEELADTEADGEPADAVDATTDVAAFETADSAGAEASSWPTEPDAGPADASETSLDGGRFAVAPRDGFHLTEYADFAAASPSASPPALSEDSEEESEPSAPVLRVTTDQASTPPAAWPRDPGAAPRDEPVLPTGGVQAEPAEPAGERGKKRGWHVRQNPQDHVREDRDVETDPMWAMPDGDGWEDEQLDEESAKVHDARGEINDRLRRRRCDEAAALIQKLAAEAGGRPVAELSLDAGDRCRALGKRNAALSCYIAASRADPVFEAPLLRLADVCLDDRDTDLAVRYLERVARLHRMRGDTRGALRLYRKIATIAPFREDILATLMRAQTTGLFED